MTPDTVLMVRPRHFGYNPETAASNSFQHDEGASHSARTALNEFDGMVRTLREKGVSICVHPDPENAVCPDAVFPNNWLVCMPHGGVYLFPMMAETRRREVNHHMVETLCAEFNLGPVTDFSNLAEKDQFLEGTGSVVFDHENKLAYACVSPRTNLSLLSDWCRLIGYTPVSFGAVDLKGQAVYHTNVVMSVGHRMVILCSEAVDNLLERNMLHQRIAASNKNILEISYSQMNAFAGNAMEVQCKSGKLWVMSSTAWRSLTPLQRAQLESDGGTAIVEIPTIELLGGGSARCMMAGLFTTHNQK